MVALVTMPGFRVTDSNGDLVAGAQLYAYLTGTLTPTPLFLDAALTTPTTNPAIANASGMFPDLYAGPTPIRVELKDSLGAEIADVDPYSSGGLVLAANGYTRPATGAVTRSLLDKIGDVWSAEDFGWVVGATSAAATNVTAINNAMAALSTLGGGTILLPPGDSYIAGSIDNKYPRILIQGAGPDNLHDAGVSTAAAPIYGTRLIATTSAVMTKLRTPYAAEQGRAASACAKNTGSGFVGISLFGGAISTGAMLVDSVSHVTVDVFATNFNATVLYDVTCGIAGTNLGEACDVQYSRLNFRFRLIDTAADKACTAVKLRGSTNANVSLNRLPLYGINIAGQHWDGNALDAVCCDNNDISVQGLRAGGSGNLLLARGQNAAADKFCDSNNFYYVAGNGPVYAEGTGDSGVVAGVTNKIFVDYGNNSIIPTAGTASYWSVEENKYGIRYGWAYGATAFADAHANIKAQRDLLSTATLRVHNTNGNHVVLVDATGNVWGLHIDGSNGDLRINRVSGTGGINLGNGAVVKIPALANAVDDAAAAGLSVPVTGLYRNGSVLMVRVT